MMERLTMYAPYGYESINPIDLELDEYSYINFERLLEKLGEYEDFEEIFREKMTDTACLFLSDKEEFGKWIDRNKWIAKKCDEYARAEEQGLLLRLPVPIGTTVWGLYEFSGGGRVPNWYELHEYNFALSMLEEIGKTVFLTQAEAEQKLKEMESDNNGTME